MKAEITHDGEQVVITLKTGERFFISEHDALSVTGYALRVICDGRGGLLINPVASNSVILTTPRGFREQTHEVDQVVAERKRKHRQ